MNGGSIELVHGDYNPTYNGGGTTLHEDKMGWLQDDLTG